VKIFSKNAKGKKEKLRLQRTGTFLLKQFYLDERDRGYREVAVLDEVAAAGVVGFEDSSKAEKEEK
jgi:hypothetical protein